MHTPVSSRASSSEPPTAKTCSLFLPNYVQDKYLLQLLRSADDVSTWVAAEIVTSHTSKVGARLTGGPGCSRRGAASRGGPRSSLLRARGSLRLRPSKGESRVTASVDSIRHTTRLACRAPSVTPRP